MTLTISKGQEAFISESDDIAKLTGQLHSAADIQLVSKQARAKGVLYRSHQIPVLHIKVTSHGKTYELSYVVDRSRTCSRQLWLLGPADHPAHAAGEEFWNAVWSVTPKKYVEFGYYVEDYLETKAPEGVSDNLHPVIDSAID